MFKTDRFTFRGGKARPADQWAREGDTDDD